MYTLNLDIPKNKLFRRFGVGFVLYDVKGLDNLDNKELLPTIQMIRKIVPNINCFAGIIDFTGNEADGKYFAFDTVEKGMSLITNTLRSMFSLEINPVIHSTVPVLIPDFENVVITPDEFERMLEKDLPLYFYFQSKEEWRKYKEAALRLGYGALLDVFCRMDVLETITNEKEELRTTPLFSI